MSQTFVIIHNSSGASIEYPQIWYGEYALSNFLNGNISGHCLAIQSTEVYFESNSQLSDRGIFGRDRIKNCVEIFALYLRGIANLWRVA